MSDRITVTEQEVVEAVFTAISRRSNVDTSDYDNWDGVRMTGRLAYSLLSGERRPFADEVTRMRVAPARYKRLLGRLYLKESGNG